MSESGLCPGGTFENSPAFQRWEKGSIQPSPEGTAETVQSFSRPCGTCRFTHPYPAFKRWAIIGSPSGTGVGGISDFGFFSPIANLKCKLSNRPRFPHLKNFPFEFRICFGFRIS